MVSVVIAPDSFKGGISATAAAEAIAEGWLSVRPLDDVVRLPQADGGEGTLEAIAASIPGARRRSAGQVTGPDGRQTAGEWIALPDGTAAVELAQCSGLPLMLAPDPIGATTFGLGEVIRAALASGATRLMIGLGGSASTDGGLGALKALGLRLDDCRRDLSELVPPPPGGVELLTDVNAPLLGPEGAAAVFAPQKGADAAQVARLEAALAQFAGLMGGDPDQPGAGAAGGAGYGFATVWNATITPGASRIAELTGLSALTGSADILLTGEGRFDATSLRGKVVGEALAATSATVGVIAGTIELDPGCWSVSLSELADSVEAAKQHPERWLRLAGARAAREL